MKDVAQVEAGCCWFCEDDAVRYGATDDDVEEDG